MKVRHNLTVHVRCPMDGSEDVYEVTVRTHRLIRVKEILETVVLLTATPILQEEFTSQLASLLSADITTVGTHSDVMTTCKVRA